MQAVPYTGGYFSPFNNPKMEDYEDEKGMSLPMKLARETEKFIREHKDSTFFAFLSFYAVHAPIQTTEEKWAKYRDKAEEMGIAGSGFEMKKFLPMRVVQDNPVYAGLVEMTDDAVGHVLELLEELGLEENTIVIFTSDNGGVSAGDAFATSNLPLRGGKGYQFEGGIREPYFIKVPWLGLAGKSSSVPATGTDFYPTILELTGLQSCVPKNTLTVSAWFRLYKVKRSPTGPSTGTTRTTGTRAVSRARLSGWVTGN